MMTFSLGCKKYDYFTICWNTLKGLHAVLQSYFADGSESESVKFDFCEDDLELEF